MESPQTAPRFNGAIDSKFTAEISHKMTVPHHIRFSEESAHRRKPLEEEGTQVRKKMQVPERILVKGGEETQVGKADPRDITRDL